MGTYLPSDSILPVIPVTLPLPPTYHYPKCKTTQSALPKMGLDHSKKISFQALRQRLQAKDDSKFTVVKTGPCYVSHHKNAVNADNAGPLTQRFGILVKTKKDSVHLMFHFKFEKFLPEGWEQTKRRDEVQTRLPFYQYYVTKSGQPWPRNQKDDGTKVLSPLAGWESCMQKSGKTLYYKGDPDHPPTVDAEGDVYWDDDHPVEDLTYTRPEGTFTRPEANPFVTATDSSNVNDVAEALADATHLDA